MTVKSAESLYHILVLALRFKSNPLNNSKMLFIWYSNWDTDPEFANVRAYISFLNAIDPRGQVYVFENLEDYEGITNQ